MKTEIENPEIIKKDISLSFQEIEITKENLEKYCAEAAGNYGATFPEFESAEMDSLSINGSIRGVFGYHSVVGTNNTCGPACIGTIMDFYGLGWSHIRKESDGHYNNDAYVKQIMKWSGAPDIVGGVFGTSPMRIVDTMKRLKLKSRWYGNGSSKDTVNAIKREIDRGRPVYVLVDYGQLGHNFLLDWQVAYAYNASDIICKVVSGRNHFYRWPNSDFEKVLNNNIPNWNRTFITVRK